MGRMKHGKPNPHNDKKKVVLKTEEIEKRKPKEIVGAHIYLGYIKFSDVQRLQLLISNFDHS